MLKVLRVAIVLMVGLVSPALAITDVPEIDAGMAQNGIALLVGGVAVLMGRRRK